MEMGLEENKQIYEQTIPKLTSLIFCDEQQERK